VYLHREQSRRVESALDREQPVEAPQQQPRAYQQYERERNFRNDKRSTRASVSAAGAR
jgi:hypothetical protein